jgi:hypothetical protein
MSSQKQTDDLCSLDDVKSYVFRGGGDMTKQDDDLLQRLITAVSEFLRKEASTVFDVQTHTEIRSGAGGRQRMMHFKFRPCTSVSSLYIDGVLIPARSTSPTAYGSSGYTFTEDHITLSGYTFTHGKDNVQMAYEAGYDSVPKDLQQASIVTVGRRYREIERLGQKSKILQGESVTFDLDDLDDFSQRTIDRYKRVIPI